MAAAYSSRAPLRDASNSGGGLSVEMLKQKLGERFRDTGVLDEVKAHLRGRFVSQMNLSLAPPELAAAGAAAGGSVDATMAAAAATTSGTAGTMDLAEQVSHSLVAEHLVICGMRATAGVFEPECGAGKRGGLCSRGDMLMRLGVSPASTVHQNLLFGGGAAAVGKPRPSLLRMLVDEVSRPNPEIGVVGVAHSRAAVASTQTDLSGPTPREALDETLRRLHSEHEAKLESRISSEQATVEEQMLRFQRNCEARIERTYQQEQTRWRTNELDKVSQ